MPLTLDSSIRNARSGGLKSNGGNGYNVRNGQKLVLGPVFDAESRGDVYFCSFCCLETILTLLIIVNPTL